MSHRSRATSLLGHLPAIEQGYVRLITEYVDLREYFERKQRRYSKASHYSHYQDAYYRQQYVPLTSLPFQKTPKHASVGLTALNLWSTGIQSQADLPFSPETLYELRARVLDTEQPAFLWENVAEHLEALGLNAVSAGAQQIRAFKNRTYLDAYTINGISVPFGSTLVSDLVVPASAARDYNIRAWEQLVALSGVIDRICAVSIEQLLAIKLRPEVAITVAAVRRHLRRGLAIDTVFAALYRSGQLKGFASAFKD